MASRMIWVLRSIFHYEGSTVIRAYESHAEANAACDAATAYHATLIEPNTDLRGAAWEAEIARYNEWRSAHPAGPDCLTADEFDVCAIELRLSDTPSGKPNT